MITLSWFWALIDIVWLYLLGIILKLGEKRTEQENTIYAIIWVCLQIFLWFFSFTDYLMYHAVMNTVVPYNLCVFILFSQNASGTLYSIQVLLVWPATHKAWAGCRAGFPGDQSLCERDGDAAGSLCVTGIDKDQRYKLVIPLHMQIVLNHLI